MSSEEGFAAGWKPKQGDRVEGRIVSLDTRQGEYEPYPVVTVESEDGTATAIHAFHDVLRGELAKRRPQVGDRLIVTYFGRKTGNSGTSYNAYAVETPDRPPPPFRWDAFGEADSEQESADEPESEADDDVPF
jgi:hypothetical protein